MATTYLEITFRRGKPLAAYLYLAGEARARSKRSQPIEHGLVLDYGSDDKLIGIEITSPASATLEHVNSVLEQHDLPPLASEELSPLKAP